MLSPAACPLTNQNQERKSPLRGSSFPFFMTCAPSRLESVFMLILRLENAPGRCFPGSAPSPLERSRADRLPEKIHLPCLASGSSGQADSKFAGIRVFGPESGKQVPRSWQLRISREPFSESWGMRQVLSWVLHTSRRQNRVANPRCDSSRRAASQSVLPVCPNRSAG